MGHVILWFIFHPQNTEKPKIPGIMFCCVSIWKWNILSRINEVNSIRFLNFLNPHLDEIWQIREFPVANLFRVCFLLLSQFGSSSNFLCLFHHFLVVICVSNLSRWWENLESEILIDVFCYSSKSYQISMCNRRRETKPFSLYIRRFYRQKIELVNFLLIFFVSCWNIFFCFTFFFLESFEFHHETTMKGYWWWKKLLHEISFTNSNFLVLKAHSCNMKISTKLKKWAKVDWIDFYDSFQSFSRAIIKVEWNFQLNKKLFFIKFLHFLIQYSIPINFQHSQLINWNYTVSLEDFNFFL